MNSQLIKRFIVYAIILLILQIPLLHNWVINGVAFPFPYIGFIILLPHFLGRSGQMITAFAVGLVVDIFSNTPGMHASMSVLIAYTRNNWLSVVTDVSDEDLELSVHHLGWIGMLLFVWPMVFVHHLGIFVLENEGVSDFLRVLAKSFWSSLLSFSIIMVAAIVAIRPKLR